MSMELVSIMLVCCAGVLYTAAFVLYAYQLKTRTDKYTIMPLVFAGCGMVLQTALLGVVAIKLSGTQLSGANILMLASWTIMVAYFLFEVFSKRRSYGAFVIPVVLIAMTVAWNLGAGSAPPEGNAVYAEWPLLVIHIIAYFVAAAIFLLGGVSAVMMLFQERQLKKKQMEIVESRMPGLSFLKKVMRRSALIGLPIYLLGILLGVMRATGLGLEMWWASPRIALSVVVLITYCTIVVQAYVVKATSTTIAKTHIFASFLIVILTIMSSVLPMLGN